MEQESKINGVRTQKVDQGPVAVVDLTAFCIGSDGRDGEGIFLVIESPCSFTNHMHC